MKYKSFMVGALLVAVASILMVTGCKDPAANSGNDLDGDDSTKVDTTAVPREAPADSAKVEEEPEVE